MVETGGQPGVSDLVFRKKQSHQIRHGSGIIHHSAGPFRQVPPALPVEQADDPAALAAKAKISPQQAESAALAKYPGGSVVEKAQLEDENGTVVYGVGIKAADGKTYAVKVDAGSGAVVSSQDGGADAAEAGAEGAETEK